MRRFRFGLEKVLELRRYSERERELKLAEVTGLIVGAEQEATSIESARQEAAFVSVQPGRVDLNSLNSRQEYLALLERRTLELRGRIARLERERDSAREEYLTASRARKAVSQLKERREREHYREGRHQEVMEMDEVGLTLAYRRLQEETDV